LRQVLGNLLQNANRHTPPETPVRVRVVDSEAEAVIEVADDGPGIPIDDANRVFERFWRSDPSRTRASGGAGLGLSIVAAIAAAHGGRAEVQSEPGRGSVFRVHLPHVTPTVIAIPVTEADPVSPAGAPEGANVPVADLDEP
jgi:two-component system, OmpR family, sensor kinase